MTTVKNIYDYLNEIAPFDTMEDYDNSGLLIGDMDKEVKTCVLSLDATAAVTDFAVGMGAELLLTHHPVIYNPLKSIKSGSVIHELIASSISVISVHTNYDKAIGGINDVLASLLGLTPLKHFENGVVVGSLEHEMSIDDFALFVSDTLECAGLRYTDSQELIKNVAVCGGSGAEFLLNAKENADCYVTGELKYHDMLELSEEGFPVIAAGHYETECLPFVALKTRLQEAFPDVEFIITPQKNPILAV